jgi:hypothetical protein
MSGRFSVPLRWQPGYRSVTLPRTACRLAAAALRREAAQGHTAAKSLKASSASWVFVDPNEALSVELTKQDQIVLRNTRLAVTQHVKTMLLELLEYGLMLESQAAISVTAAQEGGR